MHCHSKQDEIETLVKAGMNVLLEGERGSGKSTMIKNVADKLEYKFYTTSMTKQTTLNALLGFLSINGTYIPSLLRNAVETGGLMLLDELDAADPNVILCLNTLENGYLACPDKIVEVHKDFRLCATANPSTEHQIYTGRSKLDAATLDRFEKVTIDRDPDLEESLTCKDTVQEINIMRKLLTSNSMSKTLSMRDAIRLHKRKQLNLDTGYYKTLLEHKELFSDYEKLIKKAKPKRAKKQSECTTIDELWEVLNKEGKLKGSAGKNSRWPSRDKNSFSDDMYDAIFKGGIPAEDRFKQEYKLGTNGVSDHYPARSQEEKRLADEWFGRYKHSNGSVILPKGIEIRPVNDPLGMHYTVKMPSGQQYKFKGN